MRQSQLDITKAKDTLTAKEVAVAINASYTSILRLIQRKKLRCLPLRHKLIPRAELERFLKEEIH
jgi:excisionase family DNA binding protein